MVGKTAFFLIPRLYRLSYFHQLPIARVCSNSSVLPVSCNLGFRRNLRDSEVWKLMSLLSGLGVVCWLHLDNIRESGCWSHQENSLVNHSQGV